MHSAMWTRTLPYFKKPLGNNERVGWSDKELKLWIFCSNVTPNKVNTEKQRKEKSVKRRRRRRSGKVWNRSDLSYNVWNDVYLAMEGIGPKALTNASHDGNNEILLINKIHNVKHRLVCFFLSANTRCSSSGYRSGNANTPFSMAGQMAGTHCCYCRNDQWCFIIFSICCKSERREKKKERNTRKTNALKANSISHTLDIASECWDALRCVWWPATWTVCFPLSLHC